MASEILEGEPVVWPSLHGHVRGASIELLYADAPETAVRNPDVYELLALVDSLRIARARERQRAKKMLHDRVMRSSQVLGEA